MSKPPDGNIGGLFSYSLLEFTRYSELDPPLADTSYTASYLAPKRHGALMLTDKAPLLTHKALLLTDKAPLLTHKSSVVD